MTNELLERRVEKILPSRRGLEDLLKGKKKIRLYQGFDPTGPRLHLGHSIGLRKLMEFAREGHDAVLVFGTGTVLVGDPGGREKGRGRITKREISLNIRTWKKQAAPLVDFDKVRVLKNGDWLEKLRLRDVIEIASHVSASQLLARSMFKNRLKRGDTVWYHETLYPVLQGYDSVAMDVDLELGGTDQEFNMLVGRDLMRKMRNKEKFVMTLPMIMGTDGRPMSKSSGNCIWLQDSPRDMFAKLMAVPDKEVPSYLELVTNLPLSRVSELAGRMKQRPLEAKRELALTVTADIHGRDRAKKAADEFSLVVQKGGLPSKIPSVKIPRGAVLLDALLASGLASSKAEGRRLLSQGGVRVNGVRQKDPAAKVARGSVLQAGKRRFVRAA